MSANTTETKKKSGYSFEVFPPKKEDEFPKAYEVLDALKTLSPDFISVTYGAGGRPQQKHSGACLLYPEQTKAQCARPYDLRRLPKGSPA